jgi:hypothetical protein
VRNSKPQNEIVDANHIAEFVRLFGESFRGRIDSFLLDDSFEYIDYGEVLLAFETVCVYLLDFDVSINKEEYAKALDIMSFYRKGLSLDFCFLMVNLQKLIPDTAKL